MAEQFNVHFVYPDESHTEERHRISAEEAITFAMRAIRRPAAQVGMLEEILITDMGDSCVWHWKFGKGVVFDGQNLNE